MLPLTQDLLEQVKAIAIAPINQSLRNVVILHVKYPTVA